MNEYPAPLFDLIDHHYDIGDFKVLVEQAKGRWGEVEQDDKKNNALHYMLGYVCRDPSILIRFRSVVQRAGYMNDNVARSIHDFAFESLRSSSVARPLTVPPDVFVDATDVIAALYPAKADIASLASRAGLDQGELALVWGFEGDHRASVRDLLIVAALVQKLRAVLQRVAADHKNNKTVRALIVRIESSPAEQESSEPEDARFRDRSGQAARRPGVSGGLQAQAKTNPSARSSTAARRHDLAVQRSAIQALERLHQLMDKALAEFAREDARDAMPLVPPEWTLMECNDAVLDQRESIDVARYDEDGANTMLVHLEQLIAAVLRGVEIAEAEHDYATVTDLADEAAGAYETVAAQLGGDTGAVLSRVVPYWKMKAAHARHQDKVSRQQLQLTSKNVRAKAQNTSQQHAGTAQKPGVRR